MSNELDGKRQEILIELVPGIRKMAALADVKMQRDSRLDVLKEAARARNIELSVYRIASGDEIAAAIDSAKTWGAEALNVLSSGMLFGFRQITIERTLALRLPAMFEELNNAEEGGFAAYGPTWVHIATICGRQAVQLLRGTKVADVPPPHPTTPAPWFTPPHPITPVPVLLPLAMRPGASSAETRPSSIDTPM
jgi:putative tryptophan/tyrosine transport system substrate-binding protein